MNYFEYRIYDEVYNEIILGKKTIEFRLLNEKSESIKPKDEILFKVLDNDNKSILVEVVDKHIYNNIDELLNSTDSINNILGYNKEELTNVFNKIYGKEKVDNSKIVGIIFKIKRWLYENIYGMWENII